MRAFDANPPQGITVNSCVNKQLDLVPEDPLTTAL
jgi:hypothetical protein